MLLNDLTICTYNTTGTSHCVQFWQTCRDCFKSETEGVCLNCSNTCHKGHNLGPVRKGAFFCDCGSGRGCKAKGNGITPMSPIKAPLYPPPSYHRSLTGTPEVYCLVNGLSAKHTTVDGLSTVQQLNKLNQI